jgi:hypothetical protein
MPDPLLPVNDLRVRLTVDNAILRVNLFYPDADTAKLLCDEYRSARAKKLDEHFAAAYRTFEQTSSAYKDYKALTARHRELQAAAEEAGQLAEQARQQYEAALVEGGNLSRLLVQSEQAEQEAQNTAKAADDVAKRVVKAREAATRESQQAIRKAASELSESARQEHQAIMEELAGVLGPYLVRTAVAFNLALSMATPGDIPGSSVDPELAAYAAIE